MHDLLLLSDDSDGRDAAPAVDDGVIDDWAAYTRALHEAGVLTDGAGLHSPSAATVINGQP